MSFSKEQLNTTVAYIAQNVFEKNQSISARNQKWFEKQLSNLLHSYAKNLQTQRETQFFIHKDESFMQGFLSLLSHKSIDFPANLKIAVYSDGRVNDFSLKGAPLAVCAATLGRRSESAAALSHTLKNLAISVLSNTASTEDSDEYDDHDSKTESKPESKPESESAPYTEADDSDSSDGYELDSESTPDDSDYSSSDNELPNHFDSLAMTSEVHPPFVSAYNLAKDRGKAKQETQMSYKNPKYNPNSKHYKFR